MLPTCSEMDEETHSLFAAKLTNCHLKRLGLPEINCRIGPDCQLDSSSYIAYTQFITHSFDICVFYSYSAWQTKTQKTINSLSFAAEMSIKSLESSNILTQQIHKDQEEIKKKILESMDLHKELQNELNFSRYEIHEFAENLMNTSKKFQHEMNKQHEFTEKWLNKIYSVVLDLNTMQEVILGEIWDIGSVLFYFEFFVFFLFFTSFVETYSARSKIIWLFLAAIFAEKNFRSLASYFRTFLLIGCCFFCLFSIRKYKQYDRLSYDLLRNFVMKLGNKALIAFTPTNNVRTLPSPLKEQCFTRLKKIREVYPELEQDAVLYRRKRDSLQLGKVFRALSEKKKPLREL